MNVAEGATIEPDDEGAKAIADVGEDALGDEEELDEVGEDGSEEHIGCYDNHFVLDGKVSNEWFVTIDPSVEFLKCTSINIMIIYISAHKDTQISGSVDKFDFLPVVWGVSQPIFVYLSKNMSCKYIGLTSTNT